MLRFVLTCGRVEHSDSVHHLRAGNAPDGRFLNVSAESGVCCCVEAAPASLADRSLSQDDRGLLVRLETTRQDGTTLLFDPKTGGLHIHHPLTSPFPIFWKHEDAGRTIVVSNDLRAFSGGPLNEAGIYSLFQFGAIVAPYTIWSDVHRARPGFRTSFDRDGKITEDALRFWSSPQTNTPSAASPQPHESPAGSSQTNTPSAHPTHANAPAPTTSQPNASPAVTASEAEDRFLDALDRVLRSAAPRGNPVIFFSGGVDSGLIAARAAEFGWKDTLLVNYSRGENDPEADLADRMARHFGLRLVREYESDTLWSEALNSVGTSFPFPFGDYATFTALPLVRHVLDHHPDRTVAFEGAGADGVFGNYPKFDRWRALFQFPYFARRLFSIVYRFQRHYLNTSRKSRRYAWARISCDMPAVLASAAAENALQGIAFASAIDESVRAAVQEDLMRCMDGLPEESDADTLGRVVDVLHPVREMMAQKAWPTTLGRELSVCYPFLDSELVRMGVEEAESWPGQDSESKAVMKRLLARHVPKEWVYRPKSGPAPPTREQYQRAETIRSFRERVLVRENPLYAAIDPKVVGQMVDTAERGEPLPHMTVNFLWTLLFTSLWLDQTRA